MHSTSFAPSCSVYPPPYAPRSLEIHCTLLFQSRLIVSRGPWHFVAVSVPAYGREKRWWRCRSGHVGSVEGGRSGGVREPQLVLANDATMRQPAGACSRHTSFCRTWRRVRVRPERSAICSARQGVGARLRCHRCGRVHSLGRRQSQIKSSTESKFSKLPPDGQAAAPLRRLSSQLFLQDCPRNFADRRTSVTSTCHAKIATLYGGKLSRRAAARRSLRGAARCSDNDDDHDAAV